jgi:hypothetical protein
MKIITLHKPVNITRVYNHISQNLNQRFQSHKPTDLTFIIEQKDNAIDITLPELYDGTLYHIEADGNNLNITRNEHYTDDINNLALESTLNELFDELSGNNGTDLVQEG